MEAKSKAKTTTKRTDPKSVKPTSDAPKESKENKGSIPKGEPIVQIPQSLWIKICKFGLKQRFYDTDAISRLFMGDNIDDILSQLPPEEPNKAENKAE